MSCSLILFSCFSGLCWLFDTLLNSTNHPNSSLLLIHLLIPASLSQSVSDCPAWASFQCLCAPLVFFCSCAGSTLTGFSSGTDSGNYLVWLCFSTACSTCYLIFHPVTSLFNLPPAFSTGHPSVQPFLSLFNLLPTFSLHPACNQPVTCMSNLSPACSATLPFPADAIAPDSLLTSLDQSFISQKLWCATQVELLGSNRRWLIISEIFIKQEIEKWPSKCLMV